MSLLFYAVKASGNQFCAAKLQIIFDICKFLKEKNIKNTATQQKHKKEVNQKRAYAYKNSLCLQKRQKPIKTGRTPAKYSIEGCIPLFKVSYIIFNVSS